MPAERVLIVEDDEGVREVLKEVLEGYDYQVDAVESAEEGLRVLDSEEIAVALVDVVLPGMNGLALLEQIKKMPRETEVLIMTGYSSAASARDAIRNGAFDYLQKPFYDFDRLSTMIQRALEKRELTLKQRQLKRVQEHRTKELSAAVALDPPKPPEQSGESYSELLDFFLVMVVKELDVERASVMLMEEGTNELTIAASQGLSDIDPATVRVPLGEGIAGSVAETGQPMLVTEADSDKRLQDHKAIHGSQSFISSPIVLSVPIKNQNRVLGVVNVTSRRSGEPFDEDDVSHLMNLSSQLAPDIEAALRCEQLQQAYESLKSTQDQLVFTERMKAAGLIAAEVAHDVNNSLGVILARTELILRHLKGDSPDLQKLISGAELVMKAAVQGAETIKGIQRYTRMPRDTSHQSVDLNTIVKEAVELTRPKWKERSSGSRKGCCIKFALADIPKVRGNVFELSQAIGNLIFNAAEASPGGGDVTFTTSCEGGLVVLQVSDTGAGMDDETQKRLFEPFFTTKLTGQGLGMSVVRGIVTRHKGQITVRSEPGKGTTVRIELPGAESDRDAPSRTAAAG